MTNDATVRLFFALTAGGLEERLRPVYERLKEFPRAVRPVSPENYHITLKFLGETGRETSRLLRREFPGLRTDVPAQPVILKGLGAFPDMRRPQVLWCGLAGDRDAIGRLQGMIEDLSERHGFKRDAGKFQPHLTLARIRRSMTMPPALTEYFAAHRDAVFGESRFDRIVLYRSDIKKEGPVYTALEEILLP